MVIIVMIMDHTHRGDGLEELVGIIHYPQSYDHHWDGHEYPRGHRNYGLSVPFFLYSGGGFDAFTGVSFSCLLCRANLLFLYSPPSLTRLNPLHRAHADACKNHQHT